MIDFYFQTILDDSNGSLQNSRGGSTSSLLPAVTSISNQQVNSNAVTTAGVSQSQTSEAMPPPYFPPLTNTLTTTEATLRTTMQIRQLVSCQLSGQTVTMSTVQASQSTSECSIPVIQPAAQSYDRNPPFVENMAWVSFDFK